MKSLTYFSKYNKNSDNDGGDSGLDIQTLRDSMAEEENESNARNVDSSSIKVSDKARSFIIRAEETTVAPVVLQNTVINPTLETKRVQLTNEITPTKSDIEESTTVQIVTPQPVYDRLAELKAKLDSIKAASSQLTTTTQQTNEAWGLGVRGNATQGFNFRFSKSRVKVKKRLLPLTDGRCTSNGMVKYSTECILAVPIN